MPFEDLASPCEHFTTEQFISSNGLTYTSLTYCRLFLYYHTLADNKARLRYDERKVRIWFPLFSYFESEITGAVPYEYDWPIHIPESLTAKIYGSNSPAAE